MNLTLPLLPPLAPALDPAGERRYIARTMNIAERLSHAAAAGDAASLSRLLDEGAAIDGEASHQNPLHAAIEAFQLDCVRLLLSRGASVDQPREGGMSPLEHAVDSAIDSTIQTGGSPGDEPTAIIEALLAAGARSDGALKLAQEYSSAKVLALLANSPPRTVTDVRIDEVGIPCSKT